MDPRVVEILLNPKKIEMSRILQICQYMDINLTSKTRKECVKALSQFDYETLMRKVLLHVNNRSLWFMCRQEEIEPMPQDSHKEVIEQFIAGCRWRPHWHELLLDITCDFANEQKVLYRPLKLEDINEWNNKYFVTEGIIEEDICKEDEHGGWWKTREFKLIGFETRFSGLLHGDFKSAVGDYIKLYVDYLRNGKYVYDFQYTIILDKSCT